MMPVIRLNDATFADLKSISTWMSTKTPSETVDKLVQEMMEKLDMERDLDNEPVSPHSDGDLLEFRKTPGLSFTRVVSVSINGAKIEKPNWSRLLLCVIAAVKAKGLSGQNLVSELQVGASTSVYSDQGYRYYPDLEISVQGQSAPDSWKEVDRLAMKWQVPVEVQFQWRENEKAQHPGRAGILRSGK